MKQQNSIDEELSVSSSLPITRDSDEWGLGESLLSMIFRTSNISLRSMWSVSNPGLSARFQRRSRDAFSVFPTVISAEDLTSLGASLNSVCERGFPVNPEVGLKVSVGNLSLSGGFLEGDSSGVRTMGRGRRMFEMVIAQVMVGKSSAVDVLEYDKDSVEYMKRLDSEYDSVLLVNTPSDLPDRVGSVTAGSLESGYLPPQAFCQSYVVRSGDQILPLFVCRFEVDTDKAEPLALQPCDSCQSQPGTIWCAADGAALCPQCDELNHSVNKITLRHIRVPINERPRAAGPCAVRPDLVASHWSDSMGIAVSEESRKEYYPTTSFREILEAYKSSVRVACQGNAELDQLKETLLTRLRAQDETINHITRTFRENEESAYRKTATALQKTLSLTERRTQTLLDHEKTLQDQIQFIQWAEQLLVPYAKELSPEEWLRLWLNHYRLVRGTVAEYEKEIIVEEKLGEEIKIDGVLSVKLGG